MIFVDTSFLIALMNPRDRLHDRARRWTTVVAESMIVTENVLWEAVNAFSTLPERPKPKATVDWVRRTPECLLLPATSELFHRDLSLRDGRTDKERSLTECISFLVMQDQRIGRALTRDHHFEEAGFQALLRRDPPYLRRCGCRHDCGPPDAPEFLSVSGVAGPGACAGGGWQAQRAGAVE